ncbi:hypothetical protein D3C76_969060 [compost metagenome]
MQHLVGVGALHHRLEIQLQFTFVQGVVQPGMPVLLCQLWRTVATAQHGPGALGMLPGFVQCLVQLMQYVACRIAGVEGDDAQMGDGHAITFTGQAQVLQGGADLGGQACCILGIEVRCQQAEFAPAIACCQPGATLRNLSQALEQFADRADQRIGALPAEALIEAGQVV